MHRRRCHGRSRSSNGWQMTSPCSRSVSLIHSSCSLSPEQVATHSISRAETALQSENCRERPFFTCHPRKRACSLSWTSMLCEREQQAGIAMMT